MSKEKPSHSDHYSQPHVVIENAKVIEEPCCYASYLLPSSVHVLPSLFVSIFDFECYY
jgi:hypothetical protein